MSMTGARQLSLPTELVQAGVLDGVGWLALNNPAKRNAMTLGMWDALGLALTSFAADPDVRLVVLRGTGGRSFCAGAELAEMDRMAAEGRQAEYSATVNAGRRAVSGFEKPMIAMIQGSCVGGGLSLALQADLRIASNDSVFGIPAVKLGLAPEPGTLERMTSLLGPGVANELLLTGERIDAIRARSLGLVNRVSSPENLLPETIAWAARIAGNAPLALHVVKIGVNMFAGDASKRDTTLLSHLARQCSESGDLREGRRAFLEKRPPVFKGS